MCMFMYMDLILHSLTLFFYCLREDEPSNNWVGIYISVHGLWKIYYLTRKRKNDDIKGILQKTKQRL